MPRPPVPIPVLLAGLDRTLPNATTELVYASPFQLLAAVLLSAQMTDRGVNAATPALFARFPDAASLAHAGEDELLPYLRTINFFRSKAKHLHATAQMLVNLHAGEVPRTMEELVCLPGIGRKSANVILAAAFAAPVGIAVDTHVARVSKRLGITRHTDPLKVEQDLMRRIPEERWTVLHHQLVLHGRYVCVARTPKCDRCVFQDVCPSAFRVGGWKQQKKSPRDKQP